MSKSINQTIDQLVSESVSQQVSQEIHWITEWPVLQQSEDYFVVDYVANITLDTLWLIQNGRCFADNIFKHVFSRMKMFDFR